MHTITVKNKTTESQDLRYFNCKTEAVFGKASCEEELHSVAFHNVASKSQKTIHLETEDGNPFTVTTITAILEDGSEVKIELYGKIG